MGTFNKTRKASISYIWLEKIILKKCNTSCHSKILFSLIFFTVKVDEAS